MVLDEIVVWFGACCFFCGIHLERLIGVISIVLRYLKVILHDVGFANT